MRLRLILSFIGVVLVAILSTVLIVYINTPAQVQSFMMQGTMQGLDKLAADLESYYQTQGSWQGVESILPAGGAGMMGAGHGNGMMGQRLILADNKTRILVDSADNRIGENLTASEMDASVVLKNKAGKIIGYLLANGGMGYSNAAQKPLITRLNQAALQAGALALMIAALLAIVLAEGVIRPVRQLQKAAERVAKGDWSQAVPVKGRDELSDLASSFNAMVTSLRLSEERRRGMTADIAHELRTPLAVQRAHLEALQDGIYPMTPENLQTVLDQNVLLERLVDDLRTLALADAGELRLEPRAVNVVEFLIGMQERFRPSAEEHQLTLTITENGECPPVMADPDRLTQIFTNLVGNAIRYTPAGGEIQMGVVCKDGSIHFTVSDNGPGIPPEALANVFERFYRADKSRSREDGGSGLGLAIARQLAIAQGGTLTAENRPEGGARFTLILPAADKA